MATGSELFLAVKGKTAIDKVISSLGLTYNWADGSWDDASYDALNQKLATAYDAAISDIGLTLIDPSRLTTNHPRVGIDPHYAYIQGTDGVIRQTCRWGLQLEYDPDEMGDTEDDAILGVSLISRYFPTFLDWMKDNGGSGDVIELTPLILSQIEIARKHLVGVLPFVKDAPIIIKELHY